MCCTKFQNTNKLVGVDLLKKLFEQNNDPNRLNYQGQCHQCGSAVEIEITKTSGGFGLQGGALCETEPQKLFVLCLNCYE